MNAIADVWRWCRDRPRTTVVLALLLTQLPFVSQAFHIDDRLYLEIAHNVSASPLFPQAFGTTFEGLPVDDLAGHSHLPLVSYYLALVQAVTGSDEEAVLHLAMLIFPLMAALAFFDLAARWTGRAPTAALLLIFSPAFLVISHTLMTDVPMLAFWLIAVSRWEALLAGEGEARDRWILLAAVVAAAFVSLLAVGLLMLLTAAWWLRRDSAIARNKADLLVLVILAPLVLWSAWYLRAWFYYDRVVLLGTIGHMHQRSTWDLALMTTKAYSFVLNVGSMFLFPLAVWLGFGGPLTRRLALLAAGLALIPIFAVEPESWDWKAAILALIFGSTGVLVVVEGGRALGRAVPHERLAGLWAGGILVACLVLFSAGSVRYTLLALPPVLLIWIGEMKRRYQHVALPFFLQLSVLVTLIWAWPIAVSDFRFAEVYRREARSLVQDYGQQARLWFTGEWGFRYYLEQGGARLLSREGLGPEPGDFVVKPRLASPWVTRYDAEYLELVERRAPELALPVRILDFSSHAGFYSTAWGVLPFGIGSEPWEWFNVYRVTGRPEPASE